MDSRERLQRIIGGEAADRCGFWIGMPHPDTVPGYLKHFGAADIEAIRLRLKDDFRWLCPHFFPGAYRHPQQKPMWPPAVGTEHGKFYPLAEVETVDEVEAAEWPNPDYLDFTECLAALDRAGPYYRASGMWCSFYHGIMDLLGMENYMIKMYTHPEVLDAVTDRVCSFYYEANERFFAKAGRRVDGFFFGNDFGTQLDLICSPAHFDRYIMPWFRKFTDQGHRWGYQVILHSCGAIHKVIERLIESGVDALHPLQARAANMEAEALARDFKGRIAFIGGIDTQELLVHGTPEAVKADVRRVKALLGPRLVVSPSHEALLPNVSPENVIAMAEAAVE
jgi:uroporphyrinogen decarboxylase